MDWFSGIVVYIITWWVCLFAVLPWGIRPAVTTASEGHMPGAPENPNLKRKFLITSLVAAIIWSLIWACIHFGLIDFYDQADAMMKESLSK